MKYLLPFMITANQQAYDFKYVSKRGVIPQKIKPKYKQKKQNRRQ